MELCNYGYGVEIINFRNYGGDKELQLKWEKHIGLGKSRLIPKINQSLKFNTGF
jgi:hypothetical protein